MSDITRDNSLVTMLLVAYERSEGQSYLSALLTQPLTSIFPLLSNCEMDLTKLKNQFPEATQEELESRLESNRKTLESACKQLFDGIFDANRKVPVPITDMCSFLYDTIENVMQPSCPASPSVEDDPSRSSTTSNVQPAEKEARPIEKESSKPRTLMRMLSKKKIEFKLQDKKTELESPSKNVMIRNMINKRESDNPPKALGHRDGTSDSMVDIIQLGQTYLEGDFEAPSALTSPRMSSSTTPLTSPTSPELPKKTQVVPQVIPQTSDFSLKTDNTIKNREEMLRRPTMGASLGNLSVSEKVVGSFLFLRFIVPAITTPEANGIFLEKISPMMRRGLVLCGKMLTSLCNDNEFGHKDVTLIPCNEFLIPQRQRMKNFLQRCINNSTVKTKNGESDTTEAIRKASSNPALCAKANQGMECVQSHSRTSSQPLENRKLGRKLQSLSLENLSGRPKPTEVDPDINSFFQTLQKNIDRVSKDLQEQKKSMSPEEIQKIEKKFQEFKKLLEVGYLEEDTAQKKSTFWTRLVSIFK